LSLVNTWHVNGGGWQAPLPMHLDGPSTVVLAFGDRAMHTERALRDLTAAFPNSLVTGCSTAGEICGTTVVDGTLTVVVCRFEATRVGRAWAEVGAQDESAEAGASIARALNAPDLRSVLVFSDGLLVNGSALVEGLNAHLDANVVLTGGLAADGPRFERTWTILDGAFRSGVISAVGLYGDAVRVGHGSRGGWDVFGVERQVTRSRRNVVYALDRKPALGVYRRYLGERAAELPGSALLFPLLVHRPGVEDRALVRSVLRVSEAEQALIFAGDVPEGAYASLMRANVDRLIEGAAEAGRQAAPNGPVTSPVLVLAISCIGRRVVLGDRADEELEAVVEAFPGRPAMAGFYSYGEIAPIVRGPADFHNQTMTLTSVWEA
jgi:hypothetical protein